MTMRMCVVVAGLMAFTAPALADAKLSDDEAAAGVAAASAYGCEGGTWEKEDEGTGVYELDDAKCKDGAYDLKFDKDFKLNSMTRD